MHTTAFWLQFPMDYIAALPYSTDEKRDGLLGLGTVLRTVGTVLLMCDPRDLSISTSSAQGGPEALLNPELFLYDNFPGGIGQSEPLFRMRDRLGAQALELLEACPCNAGCPSCTGAPGEVGDKAKEVAQVLAKALTSAAEAHRVAA